MFSATSIKKTVIDSRVVMPIDTFLLGRVSCYVIDDVIDPIDTFSPESLGT